MLNMHLIHVESIAIPRKVNIKLTTFNLLICIPGFRIHQCTSLRKKNMFEFTIFNYKYNYLLCLWNDFTSELNYLNWLPNNYSNIILASSYSCPFLHLTNFSKCNQFLMDKIKSDPTFASIRYPKPFTSLLPAIQFIFSKDAITWPKVYL